MIENLLSNTLGDTSELFHFYHDKGIEGNTWKSIHEGTPLHATKLSGNINTLPGPSGGVVFNHSASDRLIFNRPVPEFVYSFVSTVEPRRIASGRIGAVIGNYQSNPERNIEIYTNNEIRIYGAPTVPICNTKVTTRSTFGYTVVEGRKEIRVFKDGLLVEVLTFTAQIPGPYVSPFYIGGDKRTSTVLFQGLISRIIGYDSPKSDDFMKEITSSNN